MSCKTIQSKLSAYLDGEMTGYEMQALRTHVNLCKSCQSELEHLRVVRTMLREMPAGPEPSQEFQVRIAKKLSNARPNYFRYAFVLAIPAICFAIFSYTRSGHEKIQDRDLIIDRELSRDQIFDAGADSTSGASLVHYTNYEAR